jgi:HAMP domain-containing protein
VTTLSSITPSVEISALSVAFNHMRESLKQAIAMIE